MNSTFMEPKPSGKRAREQVSQGELDRELLDACYDGNFEEAKALLDKGASAKARHPGGWTALHSAAGHGDMEMVSILVEGGADLNAVNFVGETALHAACYKGAQEIAFYLVQMGANPKRKDSSGKDCITYATENGYTVLAVDMLAEFLCMADVED